MSFKPSIAFCFLIFVCTEASFGQNKMFFRTGINISTLSKPLTTELDAPLSRVGYHFGLGGDYKLVRKSLFIQPSLVFSQRGYIADYKVGTQRAATSLNYLEIPVNIVAKLGSQEKSKLILMAGGYVASGIGGRTRTTNNGSLVSKASVRYNYDIQRLDYGVQAGMGFQIHYAQLLLTVQQGVANLAIDSASSTQNTVLGLSFVYLFDDVF